MALSDLIADALVLTMSPARARTVDAVRELEHKFNYFSDDQLREAAGQYVSGRMTPADPPPNWAEQFVGGLLRRPPVDDGELTGLGIAAAAFRRAPADLKVESAGLYDEQIAAAAFMLSGCHVQMATGEGKTYALIAAAFAGLGTRERVYILTPNEILAERDAHRTAPFWDFLGVSVGLCTNGYGTANASSPQWGAQIVYTTASILTFKYLFDSIATRPPSAPVTPELALLDESDAVIFHGGSDSYSAVASIESDPEIWAHAHAFAETLADAEVNDTYFVSGDVTLTNEGWERLRSETPEFAGLGPWRFARMVEAAYIAQRCVEEDVDYLREGNHLHAIDRSTGLTNRTQRPDWLIALSCLGESQRIPSSEPTGSASLLGVLRSFRVIGGASGTASDVAVDLLTMLGMQGRPAAVASRSDRMQVRPNDLVFRSFPVAVNACVQDAVEVAAARPVLVGAQNGRDARRVHQEIDQVVRGRGLPLSVRLVLEEELTQDSFDDAGRVGSICVTSYFASRGTDIRLTSDARRAGGLHLVLVGRTRELRLDRQFLGRAGRQGDPWSATYFNSLDMPMFQYFATGAIEKVMGSDWPDDLPIESKTVSKALSKAQRAAVTERRRKAASETLTSENMEAFHAVYLRMRRALQRSTDASTPDAAVIRWIAENFMERAHPEPTGEELAAYLESTLPPGESRRALESAAVTSAHPKGAVTELLIAQMSAAVQSRAADIEDHRALHRALERIAAALHHGRELVGPPGSEARSLPTDRAALERLADSFEADLAAIAELDAEGRDPSGHGTQAGEEHSDRLAWATSKWDLPMPCYFDQSCRRLTRTPTQAVAWESQRVWRRADSQLQDRLLQGNFSQVSLGARTQRRTRAIRDATEELDGQLAAAAVGILLRCDRWDELDETFYVAENQVEWVQGAEPSRGKWRPPPTPTEPADDRVDRLVSRLVGDMRRATRREARRERSDEAEVVVRAFLRSNPIAVLQSGRECALAMARFTEEDVERGVAAKKRARNAADIAEFLRRASDAQLIPEAPTRWDRLSARVGRVSRSMRSLRNADGLAAFAGFSVIALVASLLRVPVPGLPSDVSAAPLLPAWAVFCAASSALLAVLVPEGETRAALLEQFVPIQVVALTAIVSWGAFGAGDALGGAVSTVIAAAIATLLWRTARVARHKAGVDLVAVSVTAVGVWLLLSMVERGHAAVAVGVVAAALVAVARPRLGRHRLPVVGGRAGTLHAPDSTVHSFVVLELGGLLHRFVIASGSVLILLALSSTSDRLEGPQAFVVLAGLLVALSVLETTRRVSEQAVRPLLARRRAVLERPGELGGELRVARRRILAVELCTALGIVGVGAVLREQAGLSCTEAVMVIVGAVVLATFASQAVSTLRAAVAGFNTNVIPLDLPHESDLPHDGSPGSKTRAWIRRTRFAWAPVLFAYLALVQVLEVVGVLEAVGAAWNWVVR